MNRALLRPELLSAENIHQVKAAAVAVALTILFGKMDTLIIRKAAINLGQIYELMYRIARK